MQLDTSLYASAQVKCAGISPDVLEKLGEQLVAMTHLAIDGPYPVRKNARRFPKRGQLIALGAIAVTQFKETNIFDGLELTSLNPLCSTSCPNRAHTSSIAGETPTEEALVTTQQLS